LPLEKWLARLRQNVTRDICDVAFKEFLLQSTDEKLALFTRYIDGAH